MMPVISTDVETGSSPVHSAKPHLKVRLCYLCPTLFTLFKANWILLSIKGLQKTLWKGC